MALAPIQGSSLPLPPSKLSYQFQRTPTHKHQGIDLVAPLGSPVYAAEAGTVEITAKEYRQGFSGYGRVVVVAGISGRRFLYAHLEDVLVTEGQTIAEGQIIGSVGNTSFSKEYPTARMIGAHLHFEVSSGRYPRPSEGGRLDPIAFLAEKKTVPRYRRVRRGQTLLYL